jgi:hypothetical protein
MVTDPSKDMVTALGLGGVVLELGVGHLVQRLGSLGEVLIDLCGAGHQAVFTCRTGDRAAAARSTGDIAGCGWCATRQGRGDQSNIARRGIPRQ